jgi:hypothetical protein
MTTDDFPSERDRVADEECFELNGCFTGDCPHSSIHDCGKHFFKAGADWARAEMQAEIERLKLDREHLQSLVNTKEAWREQALKLKEALERAKGYMGTCDYCVDVLAEIEALGRGTEGTKE